PGGPTGCRIEKAQDPERTPVTRPWDSFLFQAELRSHETFAKGSPGFLPPGSTGNGGNPPVAPAPGWPSRAPWQHGPARSPHSPGADSIRCDRAPQRCASDSPLAFQAKFGLPPGHQWLLRDDLPRAVLLPAPCRSEFAAVATVVPGR